MSPKHESHGPGGKKRGDPGARIPETSGDRISPGVRMAVSEVDFQRNYGFSKQEKKM